MHVDENHHPDDDLYRDLLAMGLWAVTRHGMVGADFLVLGLVPEDSYGCHIASQIVRPSAR